MEIFSDMISEYKSMLNNKLMNSSINYPPTNMHMTPNLSFSKIMLHLSRLSVPVFWVSFRHHRCNNQKNWQLIELCYILGDALFHLRCQTGEMRKQRPSITPFSWLYLSLMELKLFACRWAHMVCQFQGKLATREVTTVVWMSTFKCYIVILGLNIWQ